MGFIALSVTRFDGGVDAFFVFHEKPTPLISTSRSASIPKEEIAAVAETSSVANDGDTVTAGDPTIKTEGMPDLMRELQDKMGSVDDSRLLFPEYQSGDVPRMFSSLEYIREGDSAIASRHAAGSVVGAAALIAGTTVSTDQLFTIVAWFHI